MKTMAEVLAEHQDWTYLIASNAMVCAGRNCGWSKPLDEDESSRDAYHAHQADALTAAGFGPVKAAQAEALRDAADERQTRSETLLNTMNNMAEMIGTYSHDDIVRYGAYSAEAHTAAAWLRNRAANIEPTQ